MTSRPSTAAPLLAIVAIVLPLLGAYVGAYFYLGQVGWADYDAGERIIWRTYPRPWHWIFTPAARVETLIRGCRVNCQENPV
jgi:hypothetical protein